MLIHCCLITVELFCLGFTKLCAGWSNAIISRAGLYKAGPLNGCFFSKPRAVPGLLRILFIPGQHSKAGTRCLRAEGREVCAAGGSQLWEGVVMCSPGTSSATLWLLCDSRDAPSSQSQGQSLHRGSAQHCQSCHYFLLYAAVRAERAFNLCPDKRPHCVSPENCLQLAAALDLSGKNIWKLITACQIGLYFVHHEQIGYKKLGDTQGGVQDCGAERSCSANVNSTGEERNCSREHG